MKLKKVVIIVLTVVLSSLTIANLASAGILNRSLEKEAKYLTNKNGLKYGSARDAISVETEPDLISAVGVDGVEGYVYAKDLREEMPKTPAEAVAKTEAIKEKLAKAKPNEAIVIRTIPLYDVDGTTIIGSFEIKNTAKK
jgi:hypothetical protein